jgi:hypothetical protein
LDSFLSLLLALQAPAIFSRERSLCPRTHAKDAAEEPAGVSVVDRSLHLAAMPLADRSPWAPLMSELSNFCAEVSADGFGFCRRVNCRWQKRSTKETIKPPDAVAPVHLVGSLPPFLLLLALHLISCRDG